MSLDGWQYFCTTPLCIVEPIFDAMVFIFSNFYCKNTKLIRMHPLNECFQKVRSSVLTQIRYHSFWADSTYFQWRSYYLSGGFKAKQPIFIALFLGALIYTSIITIAIAMFVFGNKWPFWSLGHISNADSSIADMCTRISAAYACMHIWHSLSSLCRTPSIISDIAHRLLIIILSHK